MLWEAVREAVQEAVREAVGSGARRSNIGR
jgi:hypothetical protein